MSKKIKTITCILLLFVCSILETNSQQTYCTPIKTSNNNSFYVSKVSLSDIFNTSDKTAGVYEYYNTITTDVLQNETYSASITYKMPNYNQGTLKVWIDFNADGDFNDSGETVYTYTTSEPFSADGITRNFQILIPNNSTVGITRMRVAINRNNLSNPCSAENKKGEFEDYDINIKPSPVPPIAICVGNPINLTLDVSGNASITADDVNNGSYDDYDGTNISMVLDKYNFSCSDISSNPNIVTLTVTDSDGLSSTCTTEVNISPYSGSFIAPTLPSVTAYCSYTAKAPIMNYQCGTTIQATTSDPTTFNGVNPLGANIPYEIEWVFDNGSTTVTSTEFITIKTPEIPSNVTVTSISETTAIVSWDSNDTEGFNIRYRLKDSTDSWTETTSTTTSKKLTGLDDGLEYEVQIKTISSCVTDYYSNLTYFTTVEVQYCNNNVNLNKDKKYFISNVNIGTINNSSTKNANVYEYYNTASTSLIAGETFDGELTYSRQSYNTTVVTIWIDFNNNGDFSDVGDQIYSVTHPGSSSAVFQVPLSNIPIPSTASLGKTRLRVSIKHTSSPTSACNFDHQAGEIEDYDVYISEPDNTAFESAIISQVYTYGTDKLIEITNTNASEIIPSNKIALALFSNVSGDLTGVIPDETFFINTTINPGSSIVVKSLGASVNVLSGTTTIENSAITNFDENDIIIITKKTDATAWENRYDLVSNIKNNTSIVRSDEVLTYKSSYSESEWIEFIDDNLSTSTNPPERHPHAALISEVTNGNLDANVRLGIHRINKTIRQNNGWSNGYPDKSRTVLVDEDLTLTSILKAKNLEISSSTKLVIENNLINVSGNINLNPNSEIRLVGTSQLIQTHIGNNNITGSGKLFVDQNSSLESKYRFNYITSPVSNSGGNTFTIASVLKDGTTPTSLSSIPKDITFIEGYDGNFKNSPTGPIEIARYWLYTFDSSDNNYIQNTENSSINSGQGFLFKGPGRAQNYTFTGVPNDGEYSFNVLESNASVLLGNPYASGLNSKKFIEDNLDAITGTLYFWEHVAEKNSKGNEGHFKTGYIGGYATRNLSMGLSANNETSNSTAVNSYNFILEAENAILGGFSKRIKDRVLLKFQNDSLTFNKIGVSKNVDTLRVVYKSLNSSEFGFYVNGDFKKSNMFIPTGNTYDTIKVPLQLKNSDTLTLKLLDSKIINIDKIILSYSLDYIEPKQYIPIGQGFFVSTDNDGGTITFNNSQREYIIEGNNSVFFKAAGTKKTKSKAEDIDMPILKLEMNYKDSNQKNRSRKIGISFNSENSFSFEKGYDSELYDLNNTDFFWKFSNDDRKYVITGVQQINDDLEVPIGILIEENGEISINNYSWNLPDKEIYLLDKQTNKSYPMNKEVKLNLLKGSYFDRFYLTFKESQNSLNTDENLTQNINVSYTKKDHVITIQNYNNTSISDVKLYTILGQEIKSWNLSKINFKENRLQLSPISKAVYILKINTDKGEFSKKVLIL